MKTSTKSAVRIIVAGSRSMRDYGIMRNTFNDYVKCRQYDADTIKSIEIVYGECDTGADAIAELFAKRNRLRLTGFPPDWKRYKKAAGPLRNKQMAEYASQSEDSVLLAFWDGNSPGTRSMIEEALNVGMWVRVTNVFTGEDMIVPSFDKPGIHKETQAE